MKTTIAFEGGKELDAALASLPNRVGKRVVKDVLLFVAEPMRRRMVRLAPRGTADDEHVADNIIAKLSRRKLDLTSANATVVVIGPTAAFPYAHHIEYGTVDTAAHPFMRPAFDSEVQRALEQIKASLWTELAARGVQQRITAPTWQSGAAGGDAP